MIRSRTFLIATVACASLAAQTTLKDAYKSSFRIGTALNQAQFSEIDKRGAAIAKSQFNAITPENVLKWELVHPEPARYAFDAPDRYVKFGEDNGMFIVGHTLVWHSQVPKWVFQDDHGEPATREFLLNRMRDHIRTVVGRYKGRIKGWDVVNEALNEDGTLRESPWFKIIGPDFIAKAFEFAHEADPTAELYYNDYSLENPAKCAGAVALVRKLKAQGVFITGIGSQGHNHMDSPTIERLDASLTAFAELGVKVMITELDVDILPSVGQYRGADVAHREDLQEKLNPYAKGLPEPVSQALAKRYADLFAVYLKHRDVVSRVTFWGVTNADSWLNNWPIRGRTSYPLLFDREGKPAPAFDAVIAAAKK